MNRKPFCSCSAPLSQCRRLRLQGRGCRTASASNTTPAWSQRTMLTIWLLTELPSKGTWKVPAWRTVRRRGGSESVRKDEITQSASALLRCAGGRGRLEEKPCLGTGHTTCPAVLLGQQRLE